MIPALLCSPRTLPLSSPRLTVSKANEHPNLGLLLPQHHCVGGAHLCVCLEIRTAFALRCLGLKGRCANVLGCAMGYCACPWCRICPIDLGALGVVRRFGDLCYLCKTLWDVDPSPSIPMPPWQCTCRYVHLYPRLY